MRDAKLTSNGNVLINNYFVTPMGIFLRLVGQQELELMNEILTPIKINLPDMEPPMWKFLWSVNLDDYSSYKPQTCNNGGDYAFYTERCFFARDNAGSIQVCYLDYQSTSAEFSYTDDGNFCNHSQMIRFNLIGIEDEKEWTFDVQGRSEEEDYQEVPLDKLATRSSLTEAMSAVNETTNEDNESEIEELTIEQSNERAALFLKLFPTAKMTNTAISRRTRTSNTRRD